MIGVRNQKKKRKPAAMFASAHHGVASGEPIYAIWPQSKVIRDMPSPDVYPNNWLTVLLRGNIQVTHEKTESAVKR